MGSDGALGMPARVGAVGMSGAAAGRRTLYRDVHITCKQVAVDSGTGGSFGPAHSGPETGFAGPGSAGFGPG